jgi:shikimate dehydrogenase
MKEAPAPAVPVRGSTTVVGVIGWPVRYSLSPEIHNAAFVALGLDWAYVPLPVPPGRLRAAVEGLVALGFAGANVTIPHKSEAATLCDELSEEAARLAAVNTLVVGEEGRIRGHDTDVAGFDRFLRGEVGHDPSGRTALIFGAGGAARACALALARAGLARLLVAVREPARAEPLARALGDLPTEVEVVPFGAAEGVELGEGGIVVNATPVGAAGERLPLPRFGAGTLVVDLLYRPDPTPLVEAARAAGAEAHGGLGMLLHQAALSFELWTGRAGPLEVMRAAALRALGRAPGTA